MSNEKINKREFDAFFEFLKQPIPAVSPSARAHPADEHAPGPAEQVSCGGTCAGRHGIVAIPRDSLTAHTGAETQAAQSAGIQGCYGSGEATCDDGGDFDA